MVMNIGALRSGDRARVEADIRGLVEIAHDNGAILKVTDFKWSAAPLPLAAAGKPQASFGASTLYGLSPKTKVQAQAWAFLAWMTTQQQPQSILNQAGKLGVPPYKPIYDSLFLQEPRTDVKKVLEHTRGELVDFVERPPREERGA